MNTKIAKEFLHMREWLDRAARIVAEGKEAYDDDGLLQEAGDSLMMKIGEAANRFSRAGVESPQGVDWADAIANRNWFIHQYDAINRGITWSTLAYDLASWRTALADTFAVADAKLGAQPAQVGDESEISER